MSKQSSMVSTGYKMKMRLFKALRERMEDTPFEKITVRSICNEAGISRASFYCHFTDKYEVATWYAGLLAQCGIYETGRSLSWREGMLKTLRGMRAVDPFFQILGKAYGDDFLTKGSVDRREENLKQTISTFKGIEADSALKLQVRSLALIETYLTNEWLMRNSIQSAELFVDDLGTAVPRELKKFIDEPSPKAALRPILDFYPIED